MQLPLTFKKILKRLFITLSIGLILLFIVFIIDLYLVHIKANFRLLNSSDNILPLTILCLFILTVLELFFEFYIYLFLKSKKKFAIFNFLAMFIIIFYYIITPYPFRLEPFLPELVNLKIKFGINKKLYFTRSQFFYSEYALNKTIMTYLKDKELLDLIKTNRTQEFISEKLDLKKWPEYMLKRDADTYGAAKIIWSNPWYIFFDKNDNVVFARHTKYYMNND